jgi:hypothetical protein
MQRSVPFRRVMMREIVAIALSALSLVRKKRDNSEGKLVFGRASALR